MSYVGSILQPGERVVYSTGPHWLVYAPAIVLLIGATTVAYFAVQSGGDVGFVALIVAAVVAALTVVLWLRAFIQRASTELAVTDTFRNYVTAA